MPDGTLSFVKPLERSEPFSSVLEYIQTQELEGKQASSIKYAQTRASNSLPRLIVSLSLSSR